MHAGCIPHGAALTCTGSWGLLGWQGAGGQRASASEGRGVCASVIRLSNECCPVASLPQSGGRSPKGPSRHCGVLVAPHLVQHLMPLIAPAGHTYCSPSSITGGWAGCWACAAAAAAAAKCAAADATPASAGRQAAIVSAMSRGWEPATGRRGGGGGAAGGPGAEGSLRLGNGVFVSGPGLPGAARGPCRPLRPLRAA